MEEENKLKKGSNKNQKIFIGIFILIVILIIAIFTYINFRATPKKVFETSLDKVFSKINEENKEDIKTITGDFKINANIETKETNEVFDILNNLEFKMNYAIDNENQKMNLGINSTYKNKELITANLYTKDDNAYIYLDKIFDKYIQLPFESYSEIFNNKEKLDDYKTIINELENALDKSLQDKYFTSEKASININEQDIKVTKNILNLNAENQKLLTKDIIDNLNNENFIKSMASLTDSSEDDIKDALNEIKNEEIDSVDDLTISIYTKGMLKEVVGLEIKDKTDTLIITKDNKDTYNFKMTGSTKFNGEIKITNKDNKELLEITINYEENKITINLESSAKYNEKIEDVNTSNSVSYEDLTEEDMNTIMNNLANNEGLEELSKLFESLN